MAGIWSFRLNIVKNLCLNYYLRNLVLFNFRGDNAKSSNEFPWISVWRLVKPHANYCVDILKHTGCVLRLLNRTDCYVWLYQKNLCMFMFEMHLISGITDGWQGCEPHRPPAKRNVKTGPLPSLFTIFLVSVACCFFAFFGVFSGDFGFLYSRSIPDFGLFLNYFLSVGRWAPSAEFPRGWNL